MTLLRMIPAVLIAVLAATTSGVAQSQATSTLTGSVFEYRVVDGDSLARLSARFGVSVAALARTNGLSANARLRSGDRLRIDNRHIASIEPGSPLVLNLPQRMLHVATASGVRSYPVAVGKPGWTTPLGAFTVVEKEKHPTWDVPKSIQEEMRQRGQPVLTRVPPGPNNPLGDYFIRLSFMNVGLHGTNAPLSIYQVVTHGCVRLHPDDIAEVFEQVAVGTTGRVIYETVLMAEAEGRLWLEVNPDVYQRQRPALTTARDLARRLDREGDVDWALAETVVRERGGIAVDVTSAPRPPMPPASTSTSALPPGIPPCS